MNKKIIPTLFALNKKQFDKKLNSLNFCQDLHIDFMDGEFVKNKSVKIPSMKNISNYPNINFQIHLMANNPIKYLKQIKKYPNIKEVFFQIEAIKSTDELEKTINKFKENNLKVGIVLNPATKVNEILYYVEDLYSVMFMSVWPGQEGQEFIEKVLEQVKILRSKYPLLNIQIDGGINDKTILKALRAGVNIFCVGSYISSSENIKENYDKLIEMIR